MTLLQAVVIWRRMTRRSDEYVVKPGLNARIAADSFIQMRRWQSPPMSTNSDTYMTPVSIREIAVAEAIGTLSTRGHGWASLILELW